MAEGLPIGRRLEHYRNHLRWHVTPSRLENFPPLGLANTNTSKLLVDAAFWLLLTQKEKYKKKKNQIRSEKKYAKNRTRRNSKLAEKVVAKMWRKLRQQLADT